MAKKQICQSEEKTRARSTNKTVFLGGKCVCGEGMVKGKEVVGDPGGSKEP